MSESVEVVNSSEWHASVSVAAEVGSVTDDQLGPVELDMLMAANSPATATTDGAESPLERAREDEAQLLMSGHDNVADTVTTEAALLEDKYAQMDLPAAPRSEPPASGRGAPPENEEDVIIAPLTVNALNTQQGRNKGKRAETGKRAPKRPRTGGGVEKVEDVGELAFRHSQKKLRREASSLSLKEVLGRSLTLSLDGQPHNSNSFPSSPQPISATTVAAGLGGGQFPSPSTPVTSSPTAWSPLMVSDITSRFLANVEQQRKQTVGKIISAASRRTTTATKSTTASLTVAVGASAGLSHSQPPASPASPAGGHTGSFAASLPDILDDELVIGDDNENELNWMPVTPNSEHSGRFARAIHAGTDSASERTRTLPHAQTMTDSVTGTQNSLTMSRFLDDAEDASLSAAEEERRRRRDAEQKRVEEEATHALARKHEMWKLKQRHARAQQLVQEDPRALEKAAAVAASSQGVSATGTVPVQDSPGKDTPEFFRRVVNPARTPTSSQVPGLESTQILSQEFASATSIAQSKLSAEDISMIRRQNNYDNTSSQSVMVFTTASSGGPGNGAGNSTAAKRTL